MKTPKISFGIIAFNAEPFIKYCINQVYPHAHEIIIVEGATKSNKSQANKYASSTDDTLKTIRQLQKKDKYKKIKLITKKTCWQDKLQMSQKYFNIATGDYVWQLDADEFYFKKDIYKVKKILQQNPHITQIAVKQISFWGGFKYYTDGWYLRHAFPNIQRVFKKEKGYQYIDHRPPTVLNTKGKSLKEIHYIDGFTLNKRYGIKMMHYSLVFPKQVQEKSFFYQKTLNRDTINWAKDCFFKLNHPFMVHNFYSLPSWLVEYSQKHPRQINQLQKDIKGNKISIELRSADDVKTLIHNPNFLIKRFIASVLSFLYYTRFKDKLSFLIRSW